METMRQILFGFLAASLALGIAAFAQKAARPAPTAADWAALAKPSRFHWCLGSWLRWRGPGVDARLRLQVRRQVLQDEVLHRRLQPRLQEEQRPLRRRGEPGGGRGAAGRGGGPSLTPAYAAKAQAQAAAQANRPEDNETANCLPPGIPASWASRIRWSFY
jgi:hypothetical protein